MTTDGLLSEIAEWRLVIGQLLVLVRYYVRSIV